MALWVTSTQGCTTFRRTLRWFRQCSVATLRCLSSTICACASIGLWPRSRRQARGGEVHLRARRLGQRGRPGVGARVRWTRPPRRGLRARLSCVLPPWPWWRGPRAPRRWHDLVRRFLRRPMCRPAGIRASDLSGNAGHGPTRRWRILYRDAGPQLPGRRGGDGP